MNDLLRALLDLDLLDPGDDSVRIGFARPLAAWAWIAVGGAAIAAGAWSYWRVAGPTAARGALALARALVLILLVLLISGPRLVQETKSVERDWVLVLVDRSASLGIADSGPAGARIEREAQLQDAISGAWSEWSTIIEERTVVWLGFDSGAYDLAVTTGGADAGGSSGPTGVDLGTPGGQRTALGTALDQALARAAARPLAGVVVLSDGRSVDEPSRGALRRLTSDGVPVHVVPLGSPDPVGDIALRFADAPRVAFAGDDIIPVTVELERVGALDVASSAVLRLVDRATGEVLDERDVTLDPASAGTTQRESIVLATSVGETGGADWTVELVPDGEDLVATNNQQRVSVDVVDRPIRVLYIDGYPRWEQRYLRNLLIREASVDSSTLMLAPDRRYLQEGDTELEALPDSPESWAEYDAIVLGDVRPDVFTPEQLEQLREHVALRGAGLIWSAGPGSTPRLWFDTALAELLPFSKGANDGSPIPGSVLLEPAPAAERLGVLRLGEPGDPGWPAELSDEAVGWSLLRYAQYIDPLMVKPTAQTIAVARPVLGGDPTPAVLSMRYGAGRSLFVATDEIWRWRYGRGERLFERFWLQLIRMLGRERLTRSGQSAVLTAEPRRAVVDQPVRIAVDLLDQSLVDADLPSVLVRLSREAGAAGPAVTSELRLDPERAASSERAATTVRYAAVWPAPEPGQWSVEVDEAALADLDLTASIEVTLPDDELRRPETDHPALAALAERTGGQVFPPEQFGAIASAAALPNRQNTTLAERTEELWDTPLALLVLVSLLTFEWVGRRLLRMA